MDDWMFGCDVCQEVFALWTASLKRTKKPLFNPHPELLSMDQKRIGAGTLGNYRGCILKKVFSKSAVKREPNFGT